MAETAAPAAHPVVVPLTGVRKAYNVGLLARPTAGTLDVCGEQTTRLADRALTRLRGHSIGFVFQHHHPITAFTAVENVTMPMLGAEEFANEAMHVRAAALIASVGLTAWQDNLAGNLDTQSADEVFALLRQVGSDHGTPVLFVTHHGTLARRCDKSIEVIDGRLTG